MLTSVFAKTIYTGRGVQDEGFLVFDHATIVGISPKARGEVTAECRVLTPAFVDAHSHIGIHRHGHPGGESESNDNLDSILALPDVLDSIQMDDEAFREAIEWGNLYSCVMPGSLNLISGRSAVIRHYAPHTGGALIGRAGIKGALGFNPMLAKDLKGTRPTTRMGALAVLRGKFEALQRKVRKGGKGKGARADLTREDEVLLELLSGKTRWRVHAHKADDIAALLRLVDEFRLRVTVEHAMDVNAPEIFGELKRRRIPVVYGPIETCASKVELRHKNWRNAGLLVASGVAFGVMTDHPVTPSHQILQQTRFLLRAGLTKADAIGRLTQQNAALLGIDRLTGSLARGKWASFICWNGDPFDLASHPTAVFGEGRELFRC
jgi:imidazolonepropionase-like amidohydrolase